MAPPKGEQCTSLSRSGGGTRQFRAALYGLAGGPLSFNPVLLFSSQARREGYRAGLIAADVYPPVHWRSLSKASGRSRDLARRILTIPMNQRYSSQDVQRVADMLKLVVP